MTEHREPDAARVAAALGSMPGTLTGFLEQVAGEPVDAVVLLQRAARAPASNVLGLPAGAAVVRRCVRLAGRGSGRSFVYADSTIAADRLPVPVRRRLAESRDPIGRVLTEHGLAFRREPLAAAASPDPAGAGAVASLGGSVLCRRYRLVVAGSPAADIAEWYLAALGEALRDRSG